MTDRTSIPPLSPFEEEIGFTRALRTGNHIFVAGTVARPQADGRYAFAAGEQADDCFAQIIGHIETLGGRAEHVVRVRMFVTDIKDADGVSAAFSRALKHVRPVGTLVAVTRLYHPDWKVEIEAEAVVTDPA